MSAPLRPRLHRLIGTDVEIVNVLNNAHGRGVLADVGTPERLPDGRFELTLSLLEPVPTETIHVTAVGAPARAARRTRRPAPRTAQARQARRNGRRRRLLLAAKVTLALVVLGALGALTYGVYLLAMWVMAHVALVLGVLAVLVVVAVTVLVKTGGCVGVHCPGCGHR